MLTLTLFATTRRVLLASLVALAAIGPLPARAESVWVGGLGGTNASRYTYLGRIAPLPGQPFGDGWAYSVFADSASYRYDGGPGRVEADSASLRLGALRQIPTMHGNLGLGLNLSARDTHLSPDDPGNRNRGFLIRPGAELQWLSKPEDRLASSVFANYTGGLRSYYAKGFIGYRTQAGWAIGPEIVAIGDPEYRARSVALAVQGLRWGPAQFGFRVGRERSEDQANRWLLGVEFSLYRGK